MATTTPNYGWTVPTSTDLVKDGATAIETLGDAIDASMNTALGTKKSGMVLLSSVAFSGVNNQALTNVFSTTYQNYKIVINIGTQTNSRLTFRLGNLGVAVSSANYSTQNLFTRSTTVTGVLSSGATVWQIPGEDITQGWHDLTVFQPFESVLTRFAGISAAAGGAGGITNNSAGFFDLTTSFTDIFLYPSTGTMTGSVSVFGLAK
jgi:hypothetical protein